jgi:hypothetical protein
MIDHGFFAHVSPTRGTPQERLTRSGILVSEFGENIAYSGTPEQAHAGLMESPGHRANMINPSFTHVGIAAGNSPGGLIVTLNFGRHPPAEAVPTFAQVSAAFNALRTEAGLTTPSPDPIYGAAAQAGADAMARGAAEPDVVKAEAAAMQREVDRLRTSRPSACVLRIEVLELAQLQKLKQLNAVVSPQLRRYGLGARLHRDERGPRLSTVLMLEGAKCR